VTSTSLRIGLRTWLVSLFLVALILVSQAQVLVQHADPARARLLTSSAHTNASCELSAAINELALELNRDSDSSAYIVIYTGKADPPGLLHRHAFGVKSVLVREKHMAPNRVVVIDGGKQDKFIAEYWLVPKGALQPRSGSVWIRDSQNAGPGKFDEFPFRAETDDLYEYRRLSTRLDGFAQALSRSRGTFAFVIGYANRERSYDTTSTKLARRTGAQIARRVLRNLVLKHGVESSRIVTLDGGYRESETVELWIVPPGGEPPKPTPTDQNGRGNTKQRSPRSILRSRASE
jgi:hypothetical protein